MSYDQKKQEHDEMMTRIRAEINGNDPREAVIADLRAQLAAVTAERDNYRAKFRDLEHELHLERGQVVLMQQRTETAEQQLMVYRVLLTQAMMVSAVESARLEDIQDFANEYFESIFDTALQSGAFVEAQCGSVGILRVAEQLNVVLEEE